MSGSGKTLRLSRILNPNDNRAVVVAADHGMMLGSIRGVTDLEKTVRSVIEGGADAVLLSLGQASRISHLFHGRKSALLVRADWTNAFRDKTYSLPARSIKHKAVASARDAVALNASGIVTYFFLGYGEDKDEAQDLELISIFARECNEVGLPLVVEPIPMGERVTGANFADLVGISIRMMVEVGADAIKAPYTGDVESFRRILESAGVPVLILGGAKAKSLRDALEVVNEALDAGAAGVVFGRQVIQASDPASVVEAIQAVVHHGKDVREVTSKSWAEPIILKVNEKNCTGCRICEMACSFNHKKVYAPSKASLRVDINWPNRHRPVVCTLCGLCVKACSTGALTVHPRLGYLQFMEEKCDSCGDCAEACSLCIIKFDEEKGMPIICDMCGGAPECVEWCQQGAIKIVKRKNSKEVDVAYGASR